MRCYVFIQTTKLHIFSIYGNFLLFIFYFLKDMRTEEQVFFKDIRTEEQVFLKDMRTEEHVLSLNQRTCSSVLMSYPSQAIPMFSCSPVLSSQAIPMFSCSPVLPLASNPHVLLFSCLTPRKQSLLFFCSPVFKNHVLMSNYHAHFSYSN